MQQDKIAAVVVTFNRLELLKIVIDALRKQTRKLDAIIVVNNSSTDGTEEWLSEQKDLTVVKQANIGSSGGQYTGFKTAYEMGYDYIWAMDDDVFPDNDCLEKLIPHIRENYTLFPIRISSKGEAVLLETKTFNLTNPFKSIWTKIIDENDVAKPTVEIDGPTFEGPFMHRDLISKIGLPEKKFFIYGDDSEYFIRAAKYGFKNLLITDAKLNRMIDIPENDSFHNWKHFYILRNIIAIDVLHGNFIVRIIRPFGYLISFLTKSQNFSEIITSFKAFFAGYFYKSEN